MAELLLLFFFFTFEKDRHKKRGARRAKQDCCLRLGGHLWPTTLPNNRCPTNSSILSLASL